MQVIRSGMVDIIREFLVVHSMLTRLVARFHEGSLRFEDALQLVGGDSSSPLYRLKEQCHSIFRSGQADGPSAVRTGALFDLAVGSLFHEAMKLRENLYQQEYYVPRVEALRGEGSEQDELFDEFEKILGSSADRLQETVDEVAVLLGQTRRQLLRLLVEQRDNPLIARCLYEHEELATGLHSEGLRALLAEIYEGAVAGYVKAGESYLESAYFAEAQAVLGEALKLEPQRPEIARLILYAEGMQAFLARDYRRSVDSLGEWLDTGVVGADAAQRTRLGLAHSAISHVHNLVEDDDAEEIARLAGVLVKRLADLRGREDKARP